jgi:hypothetical protein
MVVLLPEKDQIRPVEATAPGTYPAAGGGADFVAERPFLTVLLLWAVCVAALWLFVEHFRVPLPWADEWDLTPVITGDWPLSWWWIWQPMNEHRVPLTRLLAVGLGRLDGWNLGVAHVVNLALVSLGAFALVWSARRIRGRAAFSDAFLCLLVLSPWQFETFLLYSFAYAVPLACFCLGISAAATRWYRRSLGNCLAYLGLALVTCLSGGPAGQLWALGLCGVVPLSFLEQPSRRWRVGAALGTVTVAAACVAMLATTPTSPLHKQFLSDSWWTTFKATCRVLVAWLGSPLPVVWPWALLVPVIPGLYILGRILHRLAAVYRARNSDHPRLRDWLDLVVLLVATMGVAVMIGYGRGRYPTLFDSRYTTALLPAGVVMYLLLVRLRAPVILPNLLACIMALATGWNWSATASIVQDWHGRMTAAWQDLRDGRQPLSVWVDRHHHDVGQPEALRLTEYVVQLRRARLSVFQDRLPEPVPGLGASQVWEATAGTMAGNLRQTDDWRAIRLSTVESLDGPGATGSVAFPCTVPAEGSYLVCCHVRTPAAGHRVIVRVDDGPSSERMLPANADYFPCCVEPVRLHPGAHELKIELPEAGTRLDLVELVPVGQ